MFSSSSMAEDVVRKTRKFMIKIELRLSSLILFLPKGANAKASIVTPISRHNRQNVRYECKRSAARKEEKVHTLLLAYQDDQDAIHNVLEARHYQALCSMTMLPVC